MFNNDGIEDATDFFKLDDIEVDNQIQIGHDSNVNLENNEYSEKGVSPISFKNYSNNFIYNNDS
jgi:hypothetical protein